MGDFLDKETKQFLMIFAGIMVFLAFIYPAIQGNIFSFNLSDGLALFSKPGGSTASTSDFTLDSTKDYSAVIQTNQGDLEIDLLEDSAPKNVENLIAQFNKYAGATINVPEKNALISVDAPDTTEKIADEINADFLGLNTIKVKEVDFLSKQYNPDIKSTEAFSSASLDSYGDHSLKDFYTDALGYKYNPALTTPKAFKYMVYMTSTGPDQNATDFFIIMANSIPEVDGRYTPVGQITKGFDVLDRINESTSADIKINQMLLKIK